MQRANTSEWHISRVRFSVSLIWKTACGCYIRKWILSQEGLQWGNEDSGENSVEMLSKEEERSSAFTEKNPKC